MSEGQNECKWSYRGKGGGRQETVWCRYWGEIISGTKVLVILQARTQDFQRRGSYLGKSGPLLIYYTLWSFCPRWGSSETPPSDYGPVLDVPYYMSKAFHMQCSVTFMLHACSVITSQLTPRRVILEIYLFITGSHLIGSLDFTTAVPLT